MKVIKELLNKKEHDSQVQEILKFARSGELEKLHNTQNESVPDQLTQQETKEIFNDFSFIKRES